MSEQLCFYVMFMFLFFQGSIVGMNPVQIRATVDLYPSSRAAPAAQHPEAAAGGWTRYPNILTQESADRLTFLKTSTWSVSSLPKQA